MSARRVVIALSASCGESRAARERLGDADIIYTTQYGEIDRISREHPAAEVRAIPDATEETMEWLRSRHEGAEFITHSDLMKLRNEEEEDGPEISLSREEGEALLAVLRAAVGGDPGGPRRHIQSVIGYLERQGVGKRPLFMAFPVTATVLRRDKNSGKA